MRALSKSDEKLRSVGIWPFVRHAQQPFGIQRARKILVGEMIAIDRLAASAIAFCEICTVPLWRHEQTHVRGERTSALYHKTVDRSMYYAVLVIQRVARSRQALFSGTQSAKTAGTRIRKGMIWSVSYLLFTGDWCSIIE